MKQVTIPKDTVLWGNQVGYYAFCYPNEQEFITQDPVKANVLNYMSTRGKSALYIASAKKKVFWIDKETLTCISRTSTQSSKTLTKD